MTPAALARETAPLLADEDRRLRIAAAAQAHALAEHAGWTARRVPELDEQTRSATRNSRSDARRISFCRTGNLTAMSRSPLPAREAYRLWAPHYEAENAVTFLEDQATRRLTPPLAGLALLDAGCGTGRRLAGIDPSASPRFAIGLDLVPEMLAAGRARRPAGPPLIAADVTAMPLRDVLFDVVWCRLVVGHLRELTGLYRELARVSRPGARIIVTDFHPAAVRAGHSRTFRDAEGTVRTVEHHVHDPEAHERAAAAAGLTPDARLDMEVGPEVRSFYERAGALDRYEAQRGLPLVLALRFTR